MVVTTDYKDLEKKIRSASFELRGDKNHIAPP
jgi:hypothetical protein